MKRSTIVFALSCLSAVMLVAPARAEVDKIRVGVQPGLTHLPWAVIEHERLIEQRAKDAGLGDIKIQWFHFAGGAALNDGMVARRRLVSPDRNCPYADRLEKGQAREDGPSDPSGRWREGPIRRGRRG